MALPEKEDAGSVAAVSSLGAAAKPRIVLLGASGSGKGTQAGRLSARFGIPRISTGEMLRENVARGTALGRDAAPLLAEGRYIPDSVVVPMVRERLAEADCTEGFILDGFPRTVPQAEALGALVEGGLAEMVVVHVDVPREELVRRTLNRGREDDQGPLVMSRLAEHDIWTLPVLEWFGARVRLHAVDGHRNADAVTADLVGVLEGRA